MIAFIQQPIEQLLAANRPVNMVLRVQYPSTELQEAAVEVELWCNGVLFSSGEQQEHLPDDSAYLFGASIHVFTINIEERLQQFFNNSTPFFGLAEQPDTLHDNFQASFFIRCYEWIPDSDGFLTRNPIYIQSNTKVAINATIHPKKINSLIDYRLTSYLNKVKFLTNKPIKSIIYKDESEFLSIWGQGINGVRIITYDRQNNILQTGHFQTLTANNSIVRIAVGAANFDDIVWTNTPVILDDNVYYYTVQAGFLLNSLGFNCFLDISETRTYFLQCIPCSRTRIHFLNRFGFDDAISIKYKEETLDIKSSDYEKALPIAYTPMDSGMNRLQAFGTEILELVIPNANRTLLAWLRELAMSAKIYEVENNEYYPVKIVDTEYEYFNRSKRRLETKFTFKRSNADYSQRN